MPQTTASPVRALAADLALFAGSAAFALLTAATSVLLPHRAWGRIAVIGYAVAALVALGQLIVIRHGSAAIAARLAGTLARTVLTGLTWVATALVPLVIFAEQRAGGRLDRAQEEVLVVEAAGQRLLAHGSPYLTRAAIAALPPDDRLLGYTPYHPGMALFGLPRAIAGDWWWTDARVWFALVMLAALLLAGRLLARDPAGGGSARSRIGPALLRAFQVAAVLPLSALTLATGGDDLPVLALCLLALALGATERFGWAGLAVGVAGAMKLFALPVGIVLLVTASRGGRRSATIQYAIGAFGLPVLALAPAMLVSPSGVVENVLQFPLGRGLVTSPARSPLPGYLIANGLPAGRAIALGLLALLGVVLAGWLLLRPPQRAGAAAAFCAIGLASGIAMLPATRFGYLLYPVALAFAVPALRLLEAAGPPRRSPCRRSGRGGAELPR